MSDTELIDVVKYLRNIKENQELKKKYGFSVDDLKDQRELSTRNKEVWN